MESQPESAPESAPETASATTLTVRFGDQGAPFTMHLYDNDTAAGWYANAEDREKAFAEQYLGVSGPEVRTALLRCGQRSVAELFVAQMQDYLGLGSESRLNVPGIALGNWRWRLGPGQASEALAAEIRAMTEVYGRCEPLPEAPKAEPEDRDENTNGIEPQE